MRWVTKEKANVDRIACSWLITRFVDQEAEFLFVPEDKITQVTTETGAIPFDVEGMELSDHGERCTFDAVIEKYNLAEPALLELAKIVRGADMDTGDPPPESAGLRAYSTGFGVISKDDYENMRIQFPAYNALYAYCLEKVGGG